MANGEQFFKGAGKAAFQGALSGLLSAGIGGAIKGAGSVINEIGRAAAHGGSQAWLGGMMGQTSGLGATFASGAIGSGISPAIVSMSKRRNQAINFAQKPKTKSLV